MKYKSRVEIRILGEIEIHAATPEAAYTRMREQLGHAIDRLNMPVHYASPMLRIGSPKKVKD